ncbi:hypothetical protein GALMADRAFT_632144 [Galerina marginata CBS 339.88]|uniref:Secreted protein n=1 Tax=Galerina marginata (strain CBS 339.88) TaxID=685588 RepID=A0A067T1F6_GALM3|nr:hypothetical protein GALMADRAFT_632144 [Galerina marginata CBS 339.88]
MPSNSPVLGCLITLRPFVSAEGASLSPSSASTSTAGVFDTPSVRGFGPFSLKVPLTRWANSFDVSGRPVSAGSTVFVTRGFRAFFGSTAEAGTSGGTELCSAFSSARVGVRRSLLGLRDTLASAPTTNGIVILCKLRPSFSSLS